MAIYGQGDVPYIISYEYRKFRIITEDHSAEGGKRQRRCPVLVPLWVGDKDP